MTSNVPPPEPQQGWAPPQAEHRAPDHMAKWGPPPMPAQPMPPPQFAPPPPKRMERPSPLTGLANSWVAVAAVVVIIVRELFEGGIDDVSKLWGSIGFVGLGLLGVALLSLIVGVIQWRTTQFIADEHEFRVEKRFLSTSSRRLSYTKIQSVDIQRSVVARILRLASVKIDAGSDESTTLQYLSKGRAESLRDHLLAHMRSLQAPAHQPANPDAEAPAQTQPSAVPAAAPTLVLRVKPGTLFLGAFVSNILFFVLFALIGLTLVFIFAPGGNGAFVFAVVAGLAGHLFSNVISNWNFRIEKTEHGLRISKGLTDTSARSLRADRIQAVGIKQDFLQRLTGLYRMQVTVLGDGILSSESQTTSVVLPFGSWQQVLTVLDTFWPGINIDSIPKHPQPQRAKWLTPLAFKNQEWGVDERALYSRRGWLDRIITLVPHRRMQSIGLKQGPWQRNLKLASVNIHTTDGPVTMVIEHLDEHHARELLDEQSARARRLREASGGPDYLPHVQPSAPNPGVANPAQPEPEQR